jgi:hypothetical protein
MIMNCTILLSSSLFKHAATIPAADFKKPFHWIDDPVFIMQSGGIQAGSVSRIRLEIQVSNRGSAICEVVRHLAPITSGTILKNLPLEDRVHRFGENFVYVETGLVIGAEKQRSRFKRGDVAFMISNGSVCIFVRDSLAQPMNPIGTVLSGLELVETSAAGDVITIRKPIV